MKISLLFLLYISKAPNACCRNEKWSIFLSGTFFYSCAEWKQTNHYHQLPPSIHNPNNWSHKAYQPFLQVREFFFIPLPPPPPLHFHLAGSERVALCPGRQKMCEMCGTKGVRLFWDIIIKQADSIYLKEETLQREAGTLCQVDWAQKIAGLQILLQNLSIFNRPL